MSKHPSSAKHHLSFAIFAVVLVVLLCASSVWASEARSVPQSPNLVSGEVVVADETIGFTVLDGAMLKVRVKDQNLHYGIVPSLTDGMEPVQLTIFQIEEVAPGYEALSLIETLDLVAYKSNVTPSVELLTSLTINEVHSSGLSDEEFAKIQKEARGF